MALHANLAIGDIHVPYQWTYANASLRTGATGFVSSDVGKFARQLDDNTIWMLTATTPTWELQTSISADSNAIHKNAANEISTITEKTTPVTADLLLIEDSAASGVKKKLQVGNLPAASSPFKQSAFAQITADTTATDTSFADLLTVTLTTADGYLLIFATGSISNSNASKEMYLRVLLDTVAQRGVTIICTKLNVAEGFAIALRASVGAGSHTIKLQWKTVANTMQCRPITAAVDAEHASLLVEEVSA